MSRKSKRNRPIQENQAPGKGWLRRSAILYACAVALLLAVLLGSLLYKRGDSSSGNGNEQAALASLQAPTLGDAGARVHIVEFMDPACETCAMFFPLVKQVMAENPGQIRLSVRQVAFHNGSDYVVRLLEASRKQDKYWQTLEALLVSQSYWVPNHVVQPELVDLAVGGLGLDMDRLAADMNSPEVIARVQQDANDAITMKVTATPEYFVNGRPMPSFGTQQLLTLINEELQR
ncbi:MAG: thioredoxin domain-containing protein [Steroidobacteraceae bacterium]|nr:thioredoxin domain-containing protein [Steroidobacteraceae bacterium]